MTFSAAFGPMIVETDIDAAVIHTLRLRLPTYLHRAGAERPTVRGLEPPRPGSYANALDDEESLDHSLPAVIVTTAETLQPPEVDGDGVYSAIWNVRVSAVVRGNTGAETRERAAVYGGTVRRLLMDNPDLDGFAVATSWMNGRVAALAAGRDQGRYLAAAINDFAVFVEAVLREASGPAIADPYTPPDFPSPTFNSAQTFDQLATVQQVTTDITKRS